MSLDDALSRLHSGDLPPDEAAALRQRIADDPDVARAWEQMKLLVHGLQALPSRLPAPPVVLRERTRATWPLWAALAVAAVALLLLSRPSPPPEVLLTHGETVLDGAFLVRTEGHLIALDGRARLLLEPETGLLREGEVNQEPPMKTPLVTAALGALLTIVVYEGSAIVTPSGGVAVTVPAGQEAGFRETTTLPRAAPTPNTPAAQETATERLARLEAELEATRQALATEKFAGALVRGQLEQGRGVPTEWPAKVPEGFSPATFTQALKDRLAGHPDLSIAQVDCSEYPCIAAVRYTGDDQTMAWGDGAEDVLRPWFEGAHEHASISTNRSRFQDGVHDERFILTSVNGVDDPAIDERRKWRMDQMVGALGEEVKDGAFEAAP